MAEDDRKLTANITPFGLRMQPELKARIDVSARENNRSINSEIVARLDWSFSDGPSEITRLYQIIAENQEQIGDLRSRIRAELERTEQIRDRFDQYRHETALELSQVKSRAIPRSLLKRIESQASKTGRSPDEEIVQALEAAFPPPPPRQSTFPFSDLEMLVLHWHSEAWHPVDWDTWGRFRSGDLSTAITANAADGDNYFIVSVFDAEGNLRNIVAHNYLITESGYRSRAFEFLSQAEREEYNLLMTASSATHADERRLKELQHKMEPAFALPPDSVPALGELLKRIAPSDIVDNLLKSRGLIS